VSFDGRVSDRGAAPASADGATIEAVDFKFVPTCVLVPEGGQVLTVTVENTGDALHNITVEGQGIMRTLRAVSASASTSRSRATAP
jgi:hypothetical protein